MAVLTGSIDAATLTLKWALVLSGSGAAGTGQPSAASLAAISPLNECNYPNYTRITCTGGVISVNTAATPHRGEWTFEPVEYVGLGTGGSTVVGVILFIDGADDAHRIPLLYFDDRQTFPFVGGRDVFLVNASGGSVRSST